MASFGAGRKKCDKHGRDIALAWFLAHGYKSMTSGFRWKGILDTPSVGMGYETESRCPFQPRCPVTQAQSFSTCRCCLLFSDGFSMHTPPPPPMVHLPPKFISSLLERMKVGFFYLFYNGHACSFPTLIIQICLLTPELCSPKEHSLFCELPVIVKFEAW